MGLKNCVAFGFGGLFGAFELSVGEVVDLDFAGGAPEGPPPPSSDFDLSVFIML
jgi:hypothetical protein